MPTGTVRADDEETAAPEEEAPATERTTGAPVTERMPRAPEPPLRAADRAPSARLRATPRTVRHAVLAVIACVSVAASAFVGMKLADRQMSPAAAAARAWHGKIVKIARSGANPRGGLIVETPSGPTELGDGAEIKAGMRLRTDGRTRARLDFDDGSFVVLDRATEVTVDAAPRTLVLAKGVVLADVAHIDGAPAARVRTPSAEVRVVGTKLAVTADGDRANVEVLRGLVEIVAAGETERVSAGQEGVVTKDGRIDVAPANDLAQRAAFGEQLIATHNEDADAPVSGLGELRARRPGKKDEKDHAVRLTRHAVKIRIAGNVARTEIDETFTNDTNEVLEGIYRFPLPPGAKIERLALEVDGELVEGEFVDKAKAAAIWRGAIHNAAPKAPKPREEIVWVPGPWHDPALLEWKRGGRFELRIFPIPKKGSRRVVLSYTETVAPSSGVRRYVYPLPQGASSELTIDSFTVDARVVGHDKGAGVRVRGYELTAGDDGAATTLTGARHAFTPSGDLAIEYTLDDAKTDASAWAYRAPPAAAPSTTAVRRANSAKAKTPDPIGDDPFVAIALRPKLPKWSDTRPRDQVIVVDAGRAMFGERFARAKRLAVQLTQEMDRRDRVAVLACDVSCQAMPGGFVAPGAPAAHDVDAFLAGVSPDGASDLVEAVRAAARATGHERDRDLRVVLVSDGVATAGYRALSRVAAEVEDGLSDPRAEVVAVPLGADADVAFLSEVARGGGGVVVPYQPGQRLEATALEVLNATYGRTLRDVEIVLPDGLRDVAPSSLAPIRAGAETIVTARMASDEVKGDVVLRGKVGGDPFEARYPIDVRATTDVANAFVPRLFAAARIADRERAVTEASGDDGREELVALSRRFSVPSRFTSLLVLESEAMFRAFGIRRTDRAASWTGEVAAQGVTVPTKEDAKDAPSLDDLDDELDAFGAGGFATGSGKAGAGSGPARKRSAHRMPAPSDDSLAPFLEPTPGRTFGAPPSAPAATAAPRAAPSLPFDPRGATRQWPSDLRGGRFMKKIWERHATVAAGGASAVSAAKIDKARAAAAAAPDERKAHAELAKVLALSGQLDELEASLGTWSSRDPLDEGLIVARSDLAARRGHRDDALRILGGALAASSLSAKEASSLASAVATSYERAGRPEACAFFVTAAELRPTDTKAVARAIACERARGRATAADRWLASVPEARRAAVTRAVAKVDPGRAESVRGDVVVSATWLGGGDLDLAVLDPAGRRAAGVGAVSGARLEGLDALDHEKLAVSARKGGTYVVEVVRADAGEGGAAPVSGRLTISALGHKKTVPFTLAGPRAQVAHVVVRWKSRLVPLDEPRATR